MIQVKVLNKTQLQQFIDSDEFAQMPALPISQIRARSQMLNPRANEDDSVLLLAYIENKLVGYLGLLPDYLLMNGEQLRFAWPSGLWVHPKKRRQGVAKKLIDTAEEKWNKHLLLTEFTTQAEHLYLKRGVLVRFPSLTGIRAYMRFELKDLLGHRLKIPLLLSILDLVGNLWAIPYALFNSLWFKTDAERISTMGKEQAAFILEHQSRDLFKRSIEDLNWILSNPWLRTSSKAADRKYYFSSANKNAETIALQFKREDGSIGAVVIILKRSHHLKLKYAYFDPDFAAKIVDALMTLMFEHRLSTLTVFDKQICDQLRSVKLMPFWLKKKYVRKYMMSESLMKKGDDWERWYIHAGDGDSAFT